MIADIISSQARVAVGIVIAVVVAAVLGAGAVLAYQNAQLHEQLNVSAGAAAEQAEQLRTAAGQINTMAGQLKALSAINQKLVDDFGAQRQRLDAISRNATAQAVKLEAITHEDLDARTWGDTPLPAAVARLLDNTAADRDSAGTDAASADRIDADVQRGSQRAAH